MLIFGPFSFLIKLRWMRSGTNGYPEWNEFDGNWLSFSGVKGVGIGCTGAFSGTSDRDGFESQIL